MSSVVSEIAVTDAIVKIVMHERKGKNTFTEQLLQELGEVFARIEANKNYKVVVLTGYDSYFASGGTKESLLEINRGEMKFTDVNTYRLALDCSIPVIAAMQGHGIGGGLITGLFCDLIVMSRESVYAANFMKYGFTPGFGATYILQKKLGHSLANEMLMTAANYRGQELAQRGACFTVLNREEVLPHAIRLAENLAEKPRRSLVALKKHLAEPIRKALPYVIEKELQMHQETFTGSEVGRRINTLFDN